MVVLDLISMMEEKTYVVIGKFGEKAIFRGPVANLVDERKDLLKVEVRKIKNPCGCIKLEI